MNRAENILQVAEKLMALLESEARERDSIVLAELTSYAIQARDLARHYVKLNEGRDGHEA